MDSSQIINAAIKDKKAVILTLKGGTILPGVPMSADGHVIVIAERGIKGVTHVCPGEVAAIQVS